MNEKLQPHLRINNSFGAKCAILPGDPGRIDRIKEFLENPIELSFNREFRSVGGIYKGIKVLAVSTGIGGASTGIAVEELNNIGINNLIRIGSCGALQSNIKLGELIVVNAAVRDEGASRAYIESIFPAAADTVLLTCLIEACKENKFKYHIGIARSHDSFYTDREEEIDNYWALKGVLGSDMETAALFTIGALRGLRTASILNTVVEADGNIENEINSYVDGETKMLQGEQNEILAALEALYKLQST